MVQGEAMEKLLCIKTKTTFPGMALLLFGFLAGMIIPNLVYRFTWKQQAFSAVYLLGTYGRTAAYGKEYLYQIIGMRGGMFLLTLLRIYSVCGAPCSAVHDFYGAWPWNGICHVYPAVWIGRWSRGSGAFASPVSHLYSRVDESLRDGLQRIQGNLAQSWDFSGKSKQLFFEFPSVDSHIRAWNPSGMVHKSLDFAANPWIYKFFLDKIREKTTRYSAGYHKINIIL